MVADINIKQLLQTHWGMSGYSEPCGFFYFQKFIHRVLIQNYSRPYLCYTQKLQANNSEVPSDATWQIVYATCKLTTYDLQTLGKAELPPAGISGNLSVGC